MSTAHANRWLGWAVPIAFAVLCGPLLGSDITVFDDLDERLFHLPTIEKFMGEMPRPDVSDYPSATTPLYHLVMAAFGLAVGGEIGALRVINLVISIGALVCAGWAVGRRNAIAVLPLALSPYFIGPAVRLSTDNAALMAVFLTVGLMARDEDRPLSPGLAATAAILTRQIYAWLLGLLLIEAIRQGHLKRWLGLALPSICLALMLATWGTLTPPSFAKGHAQGLNPDTAVFALAMFGLYGPFFGGWLAPVARTHWRRLVIAAVIAGLGLAAISMPHTADPNRWGGAVWQLAARTPLLLEVNLSFWILVPIGAAVLTAIGSSGKRGMLLSVAVALWLIANLASARAYQKYYDPMALFVLAMSIQGLTGWRRAWAGPALLSLGLGVVSIARFYG